eukprot:2992842-Rhodomonas_salina.1
MSLRAIDVSSRLPSPLVACAGLRGVLCGGRAGREGERAEGRGESGAGGERADAAAGGRLPERRGHRRKDPPPYPPPPHPRRHLPLCRGGPLPPPSPPSLTLQGGERWRECEEAGSEEEGRGGS